MLAHVPVLVQSRWHTRKGSEIGFRVGPGGEKVRKKLKKTRKNFLVLKRCRDVGARAGTRSESVAHSERVRNRVQSRARGRKSPEKVEKNSKKFLGPKTLPRCWRTCRYSFRVGGTLGKGPKSGSESGQGAKKSGKS